MRICNKTEWMCEAVHRGSGTLNAADMSTKYIVEMALVLSGISHYQFKHFCWFVNLTHTSPTSYACINKYMLPQPYTKSTLRCEIPS